MARLLALTACYHSFHLLAGANILQANGLLDLDTFASSFLSALEAFTFLGDPGLNTNSSFDRVLESQPSLTYLHLRADFIRCAADRRLQQFEPS